MSAPTGDARWQAPAEVAALAGQALSDEDAWRLALLLARRAGALDEVPVGCVVRDAAGRLAGAGHDYKVAWRDPTAHAEVIALREAAARLGDWRLDGCDLFVTLEPCAMCAGAILLARVARLHYAAASPKFGAVAARARLLEEGRWNHTVAVGGAPAAVAEEAAGLLRAYFRAKRNPVD